MSRPYPAVFMLAWRFMMSKASDGFLSLISWVSVFGVSLGVLALVVVTSVINGFEGELVRVITGMNGDVLLYTRGEPLRDRGAVEEKIRRIVPSTLASTPSFVAEMMISGPNAVAGAILEGIDPETIGAVTAVPARIREGRLPTPLQEAAPATEPAEVMVGSSLADRIGAKIGTEARLVAPFLGGEGEEGAGSGAPRVFPVRVVGIVKMGMHEYDSKFVFAHLASVQKMLAYPGRITTFKLKLSSKANAREAADRLSEGFGYPFRARDWSQLNKNLFRAIEHQKVVIAICLVIIVIVAAFNVVSTLMMMIYDKTKEISILKAMGFRPGQSFQLFCLVGIGIGTVGTAIGVGLGVAVNVFLARTRLIDLPADIYSIGFLPVVTRWEEVLWIAVVSFSVCFLATIYPAYKVAVRPPLDGIRYE